MSLIGLMGGTFNPIHYGHLLIAQTVQDSLKLDKVIFIPNGTPPHKECPEFISGKKRLEMIKLAIESNPLFEAYDTEIKETGKSYTVNTVKTLKKDFPNDSFVFITGIDAFIDYEWFNFEELLELLDKFVTASRPNFEIKQFQEKLETIKNKNKILYLQTPLIEISSTDIRNRISAKRSIRYMLPDNVIDYIVKNKLYGSLNNYE